MHLVDYVHAILAYRGRVHDFVAQVAYLVHAVVGRGVDFQYVHGRARLFVAAGGAFAARLAVVRVKAVERARERLGRGGLARAAAAAEQVCVRYAPAFYLIEQRAHYRLLTHYVGKARRPP